MLIRGDIQDAVGHSADKLTEKAAIRKQNALLLDRRRNRRANAELKVIAGERQLNAGCRKPHGCKHLHRGFRAGRFCDIRQHFNEIILLTGEFHILGFLPFRHAPEKILHCSAQRLPQRTG